jgi:hypothetical protein
LKRFNWNSDKNKQLLKERGISFEDIEYYISTGHLLDVIVKLDDYEKELLESYENDEWESVEDKEAEIKRYRQYAANSLKRNKKMVLQKNLWVKPKCEFLLLGL